MELSMVNPGVDCGFATWMTLRLVKAKAAIVLNSWDTRPKVFGKSDR